MNWYQIIIVASLGLFALYVIVQSLIKVYQAVYGDKYIVDIESVGNAAFIRHRDGTLQIIHVEDVEDYVANYSNYVGREPNSLLFDLPYREVTIHDMIYKPTTKLPTVSFREPEEVSQ